MKRNRLRWAVPALAGLTALAGLAIAACGGDDDDEDASTATSAASGTAAATATQEAEPVTLRLGYFANVTHAPALVGLQDGTFAAALPENVTLEPIAFNAGPSVIEALFAGEIDISYIGPNPAINGYVKSGGEALRIVAGSTSGGASLVIQGDSDIDSPDDFADKTIASPQLGNTQDVALRSWLLEHGLKAEEQGGNVKVLPTANADTLTLFQKGEIDGAWVPEPWATRLVQQAGGKVFLDERDLWPNGQFVTTHIIVRTEFLEDHPEVVKAFLAAHVGIIESIKKDPEAAKAATNARIEADSTAALPQEVIDAAWEKLEFTYDPIASSLVQSADDAYELGFLGSSKPDLDGIYALDLLNEVLDGLSLAAVAR